MLNSIFQNENLLNLSSLTLQREKIIELSGKMSE